jgi:hypothetical protein
MGTTGGGGRTEEPRKRTFKEIRDKVEHYRRKVENAPDSAYLRAFLEELKRGEGEAAGYDGREARRRWKGRYASMQELVGPSYRRFFEGRERFGIGDPGNCSSEDYRLLGRWDALGWLLAISRERHRAEVKKTLRRGRSPEDGRGE